MRRHLVAAAAICVSLGAPAACGSSGQIARELSPNGSPAADPLPSSPQTMRTTQRPFRAAVTERDVELAQRFIAFAAGPSAATHAAVPFAAEIRLGLGRELTVTLDPESAARAESWDFEEEMFRAYMGTFSAPAHQASARRDGIAASRRPGQCLPGCRRRAPALRESPRAGT